MLLGWAGHHLDAGDTLRSPVDCVYILGGGASTRPFMAAAIYRAGYGHRILIPESIHLDSSPLPAEHMICREVLLRRGVPLDAIVQLTGTVDSTRDEAEALEAYLSTRPDATVAIVTSNFHTRRVRMIFRKMLPQHRDQLFVIATPTDDFGPDDWWHHQDGILWYLGEYVKLLREYFQY